MRIDEFSPPTAPARPSSDVVSTMEVGIASARRAYWILLGLLLTGYACSGLNHIGPNEVGLVRRFGRLVERDGKVTLYPPGLLLTWPAPIDDVIRVPVRQEHLVRIQIPVSESNSAPGSNDNATSQPSPSKDERELSGRQDVPLVTPASSVGGLGELDGEAEANTESADAGSTIDASYVLTGDQSLLSAEVETRFRIVAPDLWVASSHDPRAVIQVTLASSTAAVLRRWKIDDALLRHRSLPDVSGTNLSDEILFQFRARLERLRIGVEITAIEIISLQPPEAVADAFAAVQDARVDQDAWREEAEGDHEEICLNAERMALVAIADSKGKLDSIPGRISEELALFEADLKAWQDAPDVTRERLRREAWESIIRNAGKVITVPPGTADGRILIPFPPTESKR